MRYIYGILLGLIMSLVTAYVSIPSSRVAFEGIELPIKSKYLAVSVTFYNPGEDFWGDRKSTGGHLTSYRSAAVDPEIFPYGTKLYLPGFPELIAEDTGGAVKSKLSSRLRAYKYFLKGQISKEECDRVSLFPVIDIYIADKKEYDRLCKITPEFMLVMIPQ